MDTTQDFDIDRLFGLHGRDVAGRRWRALSVATVLTTSVATAVLLPPSHRASPSPGGAAGITPPVADVEAPGSTQVDRTGAAAITETPPPTRAQRDGCRVRFGGAGWEARDAGRPPGSARPTGPCLTMTSGQ